MLALPLVMQTSLGKASAQEHHLEKRKWLSFQSEGMQLWAFTIRNKTIPQNVTSAFVFMNSCHNATKNDRQWCHHFTIFVGQATARMASQENQPSSCDVAGSAMPREDALLNLTSPSWKKVPSPPRRKLQVKFMQFQPSHDNSESVLCQWPALNLG